MAAPEEIRFSLIVPTLNRQEELRLLLVSLQHQTLKDFEIIIVDQNEDERVSEVVLLFSPGLRINHVRQKERGASRARNVGLRVATGRIVTFPDDDCEYAADLLEKIWKIFDEHPEFDGITVSSRDKNSEGQVARLSKQGGPISKFNILRKTIEAAIFVRSSSIHDFFFDEDLGVGAKTPWWSDEGPDFVLRLINKGALFVYFPDILIYHPNPAMAYDRSAATRSYRYGLGRGRYLKKHHYPWWFVLYVWGLYIAGIILGIVKFNSGMIRYYYSGLCGRIEGYIK